MAVNREDWRWLDAAAGLAERGRPLSHPNPAVGAIVVRDEIVAGRGWTRPGGRPHAEAVALDMAGKQARGASLYVTLEPCAHRSARGRACADLIVEAGLGRVIVGCKDPDPRTAGAGIARLEQAGIAVTLMEHPAARASLAGYMSRKIAGRPFVTLKLAMSLDGCIALADRRPLAITGAVARAHVHRDRARHDAILVGGGTLRSDAPRLDVRLPGLEGRSPRRFVLTGGTAPGGWELLADPAEIRNLDDLQYLYVEGGAATAAAFLEHDLVDRLMIYRAPVLIGADGIGAIGDIGHGFGPKVAERRWKMMGSLPLGSDMLEIYE